MPPELALNDLVIEAKVEAFLSRSHQQVQVDKALVNFIITSDHPLGIVHFVTLPITERLLAALRVFSSALTLGVGGVFSRI